MFLHNLYDCLVEGLGVYWTDKEYIKIVMRTKFEFINNPIIYIGNGLLLPEDFTPSVMACRTFFNKVLDELFVASNQAQGHLCNEFCAEKLQVVIGEPGPRNAIDLVPRYLQK